MDPADAPQEDDVSRILSMRTVAVFGCSPRPERPSHSVAEYLKRQGYRIVPVNPGHKKILGKTCYPDLRAIPFPVDVVDVFRRSEAVLPVIEDAIRIKAKALWLQDGIAHPEGEAKAHAAGLLVVSDDCMLREHQDRDTAHES